MPITDSKARGESSSVRAMKFPAALLTRISSGAGLPDGIDHGFDGVEIADVARESVDGAFGGGGKFGGGLLENVFTAAADVDRGAEFEEAVGHGFAESGAAAGDEDAFVAEKILRNMSCSRFGGDVSRQQVPHRVLDRFGMTKL